MKGTQDFDVDLKFTANIIHKEDYRVIIFEIKYMFREAGDSGLSVGESPIIGELFVHCTALQILGVTTRFARHHLTFVALCTLAASSCTYAYI